jgi:AAA ATPase domain
MDLADLTFKARLAEGPAGTYAVMWTVQDTAGLSYHGTGLLWFITFLVEWLFVEDYPGPLLLLFDEPATPLHPSAQRVAAKLLASISLRHQVIYSTHSPFMIDWNFPQRIRLFGRDHETKRTHIENKPYRPLEGIQHIWDPLRESIGVTLGDVGILGQANVLVEGVTDQILLANASEMFGSTGKPHFDLARTSIIPYGDSSALGHLIAVARGRGARVVVLTGADEQGARAQRFCHRENVVGITVGDFAERTEGDRSIEDVIGIAAYVGAVNDLYAEFDWFAPIDPDRVQEELVGKSLGKYFQVLFDERFQHGFDKIAVSISIARRLAELPEAVLLRFQSLIDGINAHLDAEGREMSAR